MLYLQVPTPRSQGMGGASHKSVTYAFVTPLLVDTLVTMLNYYLKELVSASQTKYRVGGKSRRLKSPIKLNINEKHSSFK